MGGMLNMAIRRENGKIHKLHLWTDSEVEFFHTKKFNEGHLDEAVNDFLKLVKKLADGDKITTKILAPDWYGLIVIDLKDKIIYSMQSFNEIASIFMGRYSPRVIIGSREREKMDELLKLNYIEIYDNDKFLGNAHELCSTSVTSKNICEYFNENDDLAYFTLTMKPTGLKNFNIKYYETDKLEDSEKLKQDLINAGFKLSKEDKEKWSEWDKS